MPKHRSIIVVSNQIIIPHLADIHPNMIIQAQIREKLLESPTIVCLDMNNTTCKRSLLSSILTREGKARKKQYCSLYYHNRTLWQSKENQTIVAIELLVYWEI